ncbi:type III pantothenate kinase [Leeia oryzae]|uniref:type III pantothenate kinase n=1 Tax=Leeia oryzae TaxID=356662 RepID=UPI000382C878|nr:type III pantothenate kinase [Leeia oryzae]
MTNTHAPYALLIDVGNTRIKWGAYNLVTEDWQDKGTLDHDALAAWLTDNPLLRDARLLIGSHVAGAHLRQAIDTASQGRMTWLVPERQSHGITNQYQAPEKLGPDRWASLIAVHHLSPAHSLVVNAGTALTVDVLDEQGVFCGGLIVPGLQLMLASLASGTAGLPRQPGEWQAYPDNTGNALYSGAIQALAGSIMQMAHQMLQDGITPGQCVLSGGDADKIAPHLNLPCVIVDHLVLDGLACVASDLFKVKASS